MNMQVFNRLSFLYDKPFSEKFNDEEISFILEHSDIKEGLVKYCTWKQKRHNGCYIFFALDFMPFRVRKSGIDNSLEVVATRKLTDLEKLEEAQNYGSRNRIIRAWNYKYIEQLIEDEFNYNVETPDKFIKHCKWKGYSNPDFKIGTQIKLEL